MKRYFLLLVGAVATCLLLMLAFPKAEAEEVKGKSEVSAKSQMTFQEYDKVEVLEFDWGWIRWLMNSEIEADAEMTFGLVYIKPHQSNPMHMHPKSAEYLHVIEGSCEHLVGDQWVTMNIGDTVRIPKGAPHRARTKEQGLRAVIVYSRGDRQKIPVQ